MSAPKRANGEPERRTTCLHCFENVFPQFVRSSNFKWMIRLLIGGIVGSFIYTTAIGEEHSQFFDKNDAIRVQEEVKEIREIQIEVVTTLKMMQTTLEQVAEDVEEIRDRR